MLPVLSGANLVYGGGMVDCGMVMSLGQLVADAEIIRMYRKMQEGVPINEETLALDVIRKVGCSKPHLGTKHTMKHYKEQSDVMMFHRGFGNEGQIQNIKSMYEQKARDILESYDKLAVSEEVAEKIHNMVIEAEKEQRHLKYPL